MRSEKSIWAIELREFGAEPGVSSGGGSLGAWLWHLFLEADMSDPIISLFRYRLGADPRQLTDPASHAVSA